MNLEPLISFKNELTAELEELLNWWSVYAVDEENGGFYGAVNEQNYPAVAAPKGLVLNARILYTFSSAYAQTKNNHHLAIATRAYDYLQHYFLDKINGGFYWAVNEKGNLLDGKKQSYGQAFAIYGLAAYYQITADEKALQLAIQTFNDIEQFAFDPLNLGYIEALAINWQPTADNRLSEKDLNEKKSMNTHLHIIEAYAQLYVVWPDANLKKAIQQLLDNFKAHIIDPENFHLQLFFTESWEVKSSLISFGHDIEAAWLLQECAEIIKDETEIACFKNLAQQISKAATKGLNEDGALYYEYEKQTAHWVKELHWWPQAEAMVGFFNAWQITDNNKFLLLTLQSWQFIKKRIKAPNGEWYWGLNEDYSLMPNQDKAGFWKCPYHNGRACLTLIKRLENLPNRPIDNVVLGT